jgi:antitoxin component of RelBE/YafQ-DinJ toxin-antitoxin module
LSKGGFRDHIIAMSDTVISIKVDERVQREAEAALAPQGLTVVEALQQVTERLARRDGALMLEAISAFEAMEGLTRDQPSSAGPTFLQALERLIDKRDPALVLQAIAILESLTEGLHIPNAETRAAIEEARRGENMKTFATVEELFADLHSDADD